VLRVGFVYVVISSQITPLEYKIMCAVYRKRQLFHLMGWIMPY